MFCLWRISLWCFVLVCAAKIENSAVYAQKNTDNYEEIDSILNDLPNETGQLDKKCQSPDLSVLKADLINSIRDIFPEAQQSAKLGQLINNVFKNFESYQQNPTTSTSTEPALAGSEIASCGPLEECVERYLCKNSMFDGNGSNQFRSVNKCSTNRVCCHVSDKIQPTAQSVQHLQMQECGLRNISGVLSNTRPLASDEASFGEFPWMVALLKKEQIFTVPLLIYIGGGSLVAPNMVVTAAHKVAGLPVNSLTVRAGEWNCSDAAEIYAHQDQSVMRVIKHDHYMRDLNNIALLVLEGAFTPQPHISPICLPSADLGFDYSHCIVAGWGKSDDENSEYSPILKKVDVPVLSKTECNSKLRRVVRPFFGLHKSLICAGGYKDKDACLGDGGAPLVCPTRDNPNRYYQVGIVTWGVGCGLPNVPAVYANVSYLMNWVNQKANELGIDSKYYTA